MRANPVSGQKERPILFSAPMVRAILDGRKTQTRRIIKPQPTEYVTGGTFNWKGSLPFENMPIETILDACPYGIAGDRLWVRETFFPFYGGCDYRADCGRNGPWKPSIFMPRKLSRITLEITEVGVELLQEISREDAKAEGVTMPPSELYPDVNTGDKLRDQYLHLWDSINGMGAWELNPWVWVISFRNVT